MTETMNIEDIVGTPDHPKPAPPPWHVDDPYNCAHGWTDGTTWGACDCEDPSNPWPPRAAGDGPRDCRCYGCNGVPRRDRGTIAACEYKDHHCDDCHEHRRCTIAECAFERRAGADSVDQPEPRR
jgi:hypothetical protein